MAREVNEVNKAEEMLPAHSGLPEFFWNIVNVASVSRGAKCSFAGSFTSKFTSVVFLFFEVNAFMQLCTSGSKCMLLPTWFLLCLLLIEIV